MNASGDFAARRREQQVKWMWSMLEQRMLARLRSEASVRTKVRKIETEVAEGHLTPALAAEQISGVAAMSDKLRILLTGFGPFPGAPYNPTQPLVARLAQLRRPALDDVAISQPHLSRSPMPRSTGNCRRCSRKKAGCAADVRPRRAYALPAHREPRAQRRHHALARCRQHPPRASAASPAMRTR